MIKRNQKYGILAILMVVMLLFSSATGYAKGDGSGGGSGNGSGGGSGQNEPLVITSCDVDGATDVAVDKTIELTFNKNVADVTVLDKNAKCISVKDAKGNPATYTVTADEEFDARQTLYVNCELDPDTTYTINVSKDITAKNMKNKLDKDYSFTFTTAAAKDTDEQAKEPATENTESEESQSNSTVIVVIVVILAAAIGFGYFYSRKKKK